MRKINRLRHSSVLHPLKLCELINISYCFIKFGGNCYIALGNQHNHTFPYVLFLPVVSFLCNFHLPTGKNFAVLFLSLQLRCYNMIFTITDTGSVSECQHRPFWLVQCYFLSNADQQYEDSSSCGSLRFGLNGWGNSKGSFLRDGDLCLSMVGRFQYSSCLLKPPSVLSLGTEGRRTSACEPGAWPENIGLSVDKEVCTRFSSSKLHMCNITNIRKCIPYTIPLLS